MRLLLLLTDLGDRNFTLRSQELSIIIIPTFQIKNLGLKDIVYSLISQNQEMESLKSHH